MARTKPCRRFDRLDRTEREDSIMRSNPLAPGLARLVSLVAVAALGLVACSSDSGSGTPPSSQTPGSLSPAPDDGSGLANPIHPTDLTIQGRGSLSTRDDTAVHCVSDGASQTGACTAAHSATVYVTPAAGWAFDHWDPVGGKALVLTMGMEVPDKETAIFVQVK
jgi:hypothetical protein